MLFQFKSKFEFARGPCVTVVMTLVDDGVIDCDDEYLEVF